MTDRMFCNKNGNPYRIYYKILTILISLLISAAGFSQSDTLKLREQITALANIGSCGPAYYSANGKEIIFISNMSGSPQIWKIHSSGGWPVQLTAFTDPVTAMSPSPKADIIAFQLAPGGGLNTQIYIMKSDGSEVKQITKGGKTNNFFGVWSKDGSLLSFGSNEQNDTGVDFFIYDVVKGVYSLEVKNKGTGGITDFSGDNNKVLITKLASRGSNDLYLYDLKTKQEKILTEHDGPGNFFGKLTNTGDVVFEGDIVLGTVEEIEQITLEAKASLSAKSKGVVVTGQGFRWPGATIPFTIDAGLSNAARVNDAIAHWHDRTGIRLIPRTNESNFVTFRPGSGCSSSVGMKGGQQFINLADGCGTGSTIHEIGHTVGLWHEQSREDRDSFIKIFWENIEDGKEHNFNQHIIDGDDVGQYDFGSIMHYSETAFSKNGKPTIETLNGADIGQRTQLSTGDVNAVNYMYFPSVPVLIQPGVYTLQQKSNNRFMDAHEISSKDFSVVSRPAQNNSTQRWIVRPIGGIFTIQQKSNNRFVDAHENEVNDFTLVTRPAQNNSTQRWILTGIGGPFTIQQQSNNRFVDAHDNAAKDFRLVTRTAQNDDTQKWTIINLGNNTFTIQQKSSGRFMDAHEIAEKDFALVTRTAQNNNTQRWVLTPVATLCTIQQQSNNRFLDAHDTAANDFRLVTRTAQNNDTQIWILTPLGNNTFTLQQKSNSQFMDAHEIESKDFALVTRTAQNNNTQRWIVKKV